MLRHNHAYIFLKKPLLTVSNTAFFLVAVIFFSNAWWIFIMLFIRNHMLRWSRFIIQRGQIALKMVFWLTNIWRGFHLSKRRDFLLWDTFLLVESLDWHIICGVIERIMMSSHELWRLQNQRCKQILIYFMEGSIILGSFMTFHCTAVLALIRCSVFRRDIIPVSLVTFSLLLWADIFLVTKKTKRFLILLWSYCATKFRSSLCLKSFLYNLFEQSASF